MTNTVFRDCLFLFLIWGGDLLFFRWFRRDDYLCLGVAFCLGVVRRCLPLSGCVRWFRVCLFCMLGKT